MREKIKNALKTNYANLGLGDKALDGVASFLAKTVTNEEEITSVIASEDTRNLLKAFQGESDALRNRAAQLEKDLNAYKEKHPEGGAPEPPKPSKKDDDEPEWAKRLREQNEKILARQKADDDARAAKAARESVESMLKKAGCTNPGILNATLKGFALGKDEDVDSAVERLKGEYNTSYKETFGEGAVPPLGGAPFSDAKSAIEHKNKFLEAQGLLPKKDN